MHAGAEVQFVAKLRDGAAQSLGRRTRLMARGSYLTLSM
jgi:hypothetical protein